MVMEPGLSEQMKTQLKNNLRQVTIEIEEMLNTMDSNDCRILSEFEHVHDVFSELQKTAASHYLNAYLSPFTDSYQSFSTAIQHFSERKHGALMAIQRKEPLGPLIHSGTPILANVSHALLESIFYPGSILHDGAVLIKENTIVSAGNVLPLSQQDTKGKKLGTRHRAAVGLSEKSDAIVLVVSEETGRASFALEGTLYPIHPGGLI
ncbi:sporulation-specific diadenylate cyclase CdaS [Oceanobacillus saliphilus]|uniref:sporulation-specific diadenylate cyclase CdaS n=1 Tax=Oceanobacillus saliphilus TaxID=2925834 RepID=UPI00201DBFF4|nr:sporulation-specific diadenylate cyclase CdaS [Oceanobacillus saliphilus]